MSDPTFTIDGIADETIAAMAAAPEETAARPMRPGYLPGGQPLHLCAAIRCDLATIFHDEFTTYIPQRQDEFAFLLYMAAQPAADRGKAWRAPRPDGPPLIADFAAFRQAVADWVDATFRDSEWDQIRSLALELWTRHDRARVTITEGKVPAAA